MGEDGLISRCLVRASAFAKKHTIAAPIIATSAFILVISCVSIYANVLLYDYQPAGTIVTGIGKTASITGTFVHYDTNWFLMIAQHGYKTLNEYAFLPLYPLAIRVFKSITNLSYVWSATILSWLILCATSVVLLKWFELEIKRLGKSISPWLPLVLMALFPTSLYLAMPYSDGFFMLLNVSALYFYRKDRYWAAAIFATLSSATRYQGILLFVYFGAELYFSKKRNFKKIIPMIGAFLGLSLYMLFLKIHTGNALEFITAEKQWGRLHGNLLINLLKSFRPIELWFVSVVIFGLKMMWKHLDRPLFIYSLVFILEPLASGTFAGLNRYILNLVPLFLVLALVDNKDTTHTVKLIYLMSSIFLLGWYALFFANNYLVG
jgi:Gpi18-like mannosyltransferase